jgi:GTP-binding protein EngB required for normal cell division
MDYLKISLLSPYKDYTATVGNFIFFQDKFSYEEENPTKFKEQTEKIISSNEKICISINPELNKTNIEELVKLVNEKISSEKIPFIFFIKNFSSICLDQEEDLFFQQILIKNRLNKSTRFCVIAYSGQKKEEDSEILQINDSSCEANLKAYLNFLKITTGVSKLHSFSFNFYKPSSFYNSFFKFIFEQPAKLDISDKEIVELFLEKGQYLGEIIITGSAGQGKSTFLNKVFNKELAETGGIERASGVSKSIVPYKDFFYTDKKTDHKIRIYDMPGYGDLTVSKEMLIKFWKDNLCRKEIKFILFVKRIDANRMMREEALMLKIFCECVIESGIPSDNIIFIATHCDKMDSQEATDRSIQFLLKALNEKNNLNIRKVIKFNKHNPVPSLKELYELCLKTKTTLKLNNDIDFKKAKLMILESILAGDITCFASDSKVKTIKNGYEVDSDISDLNLGDMVLTRKGKFEKVITISKFLQNRMYKILKFTLGNIILKVSEFHYLYVKKGNYLEKICAKNCKIGDEFLFISEENTKFKKIEKIEEHLWHYLVNVRTESSNLVVNQIYCSTDTEHDLGSLGKIVLKIANKIHPKLPQKINQVSLNFHKKINQLIGKS